jgi:hypothetical protein
MTPKKREIGECIYCGFKGEMSDEHGWPAFLGEFDGFPNLRKHVCDACNGRLGILEDQFSHIDEIAFFRQLLNIEGRRTHRKIDPFVRGSAGAAPVRLAVTDPKSGLELLVTIDPGFDGSSINTHWLNQLVAIDPEGKEIQIPLGDDIQTLDRLVGLLETAGVKPPARVYWLATGALKNVIRSLVQASVLGYEWRELEEPGRVVRNGAEIVSSVPKDAFYVYRAIAKIALNYFLASSSGYVTGLEPYLHAVKDYIYAGGEDEKHVAAKGHHILQVPANAVPGSWCHLATADYHGGLLSVSLQFFYGPNYPRPPRYDVTLAHTNDVTPEFSRHGHQFVYYNPEDRTAKHVGRADPLFLSRFQRP